MKNMALAGRACRRTCRQLTQLGLIIISKIRVTGVAAPGVFPSLRLPGRKSDFYRDITDPEILTPPGLQIFEQKSEHSDTAAGTEPSSAAPTVPESPASIDSPRSSAHIQVQNSRCRRLREADSLRNCHGWHGFRAWVPHVHAP